MKINEVVIGNLKLFREGKNLRNQGRNHCARLRTGKGDY